MMVKHNLKNVKIKQMGVPDRFIEHGTIEQCRQECGLSKSDFIKAINEFLNN
ncbi:MAG TPA: hypothetical protein PLF61_01065 [Candidatus Goldiibacteriota bacterium]|nr:hypothetical protein [Candidatus Goldiibacteriota bacterium]